MSVRETDAGASVRARAPVAGILLLALAGCSNDELLAAPSDAGAPADAALVEPKGTPWFTWVHGVVDAPRVAFCFVQLLNGVVTEPSGVLTPREGLAWGEAVTTPDPGGFDWGGDDFQPFLIAGDVSLIEDAGCRAAKELAESGDGTIRMLPLSVIPAGTLEGARHHVMVATGCIGGACGAEPALSEVWAVLSRITEPAHVGLQGVNASRGSRALDFSSAGIVFAEDVAYGAIAPFPPLLAHDKSAYEAPSLKADGVDGVFTSSWAEALERGGLSEIEDGRSYVAIAIGPLGSGGSFNPRALTVVPTSPY